MEGRRRLPAILVPVRTTAMACYRQSWRLEGPVLADHGPFAYGRQTRPVAPAAAAEGAQQGAADNGGSYRTLRPTTAT